MSVDIAQAAINRLMVGFQRTSYLDKDEVYPQLREYEKKGADCAISLYRNASVKGYIRPLDNVKKGYQTVLEKLTWTDYDNSMKAHAYISGFFRAFEKLRLMESQIRPPKHEKEGILSRLMA